MSEPNPYQSPEIPVESSAPSRRPGEDALYFAAQCQNIIGGLGLLFLVVALGEAIIVLSLNPDPWAVLGKGRGGQGGFVICAVMLPQCLLMLAGGISMHQHKRRWLAIAGAWAGILPFCGCYVFSLISGIWALTVLHQPEVKALFAEKKQANLSVVDTPPGEAA